MLTEHLRLIVQSRLRDHPAAAKPSPVIKDENVRILERGLNVTLITKIENNVNRKKIII